MVTAAAAIGMAVSVGFTVAATADAAATPAIRTVFAADDAYVSDTRTSTNFGAADKLVVGTLSGETKTSYVKFETGAFPAGAQITGARLILPFTDTPVTARVSAYPVTGAWTEGNISGAALPATGATAVGSAVPRTTDPSVTIDLTGTVTKAGSYSSARGQASTTEVTRFQSAESGDQKTAGPRLVVTYVPPVTQTTPTTTKPGTTTPTTPVTTK